MQDSHTPTPEEPQGSYAQWISAAKDDDYYKGRRFFGWFLASLMVLGSIYMIYTAFDLPPLQEIENPESDLSTQVIAADGERLGAFFIRENRVNVKLSDVSPYVIDALISTEDARFYEHTGVDYWSIPAIIKRYFSGTTSGASTITMQLSRNLFNLVGEDRTLNRKIKEVIVSAVLEKYYTKQEIMEAYLNTVNIYSNTYGIETASQRLFGKKAKDLNIQESAVIVAMLKGQGVFDPIRNADVVVGRRNLVVELMQRHGFLPSQQVVDSIKALPLVTTRQRLEHEAGLAPYFRQHLRDYLKEWCKNNKKPNGEPYNLYTDGLRVYTTVDSRMQGHAEAAVREHMTELQKTFDNHIRGHEAYKSQPDILVALMHASDRYRLAKQAGKSDEQIRTEFEKPVRMLVFDWAGSRDTIMSPMDSLRFHARILETGLVAIDPTTGQVKAWVGGIDFKQFKYDHVAKGTRQVGSTFKPFVYVAALDKGRRPCDLELNQPVVFENTDGAGARWIPKNSDGEYGGIMTLRTALATSTNLVTARLMKQLGPATVVEYARRCGITSPMDVVPSLCLGVADLNLMELTSGYTTFVNLGEHIKPYFVTRIEDKRGNILAEFYPEGTRAVSENTAYVLVDMLKGVVDMPGGTAHRLRTRYQFKNPIAGKTGTTQNHSDGWFMGATPNLVSGVWVGCADRRMRFRSISLGQGANMALPIWALFMQKVYADNRIGLPQEPFRVPVGYKDEGCVGRGPMGGGSTDRNGKKIAKSSDDLDSFE
ncbi:MAG: penicillin-binding protein [Bacteroidetes bacterium]|nr:MAG: penicillin-binding protein [Bacteroidota bacterium]